MILSQAMKRHAPAADRNREPIREVLASYLPRPGLVLEIASGSGQHAVWMAQALPDVEWQPTDIDETALASIAAYREEAALPNLRPPLRLDVIDARWPIEEADAIVCINMIHIAPWEATLALFAGARRTLRDGGVLYLYGPYRFDGETAASNEAFHASLVARDARWGVRDVRDLRALGDEHGLALEHVIAMPANNHSLVFRRI